MALLVDVTAVSGIPGSIVQFGGLPLAGIFASLSQAMNTSMTRELVFALKKLRTVGIDDLSLWRAALKGHEVAVSALLEAGADTNTVDERGWAPLCFVACNGQEKCVELLLGARAAVDHADNNALTPLMYAAANGSDKCVQRLLEAGAEVDKATPFGTPLSWAAKNGHEKCAALLRAAGAKDVR